MVKKRTWEDLMEPVQSDSDDDSPDEEIVQRLLRTGTVEDEEASEDEESEEDKEEDEEDDEVAGQVKDIPFEDLQRMRSDGSGVQKLQRPLGSRNLKRENKNRPMELPTKKPVPRFRQVIEAPKLVVRDPRFESLCGEYDENRFKSAYQFLYSEQLPSELQKLKKVMKKEKDPERRAEHKKAIQTIAQQIREESRRKERQVKEREKKVGERAAVESGKQPFYLKKSAKRKQDLVEKYKELKASGKLEAFLAKRRKKNATKEHKKIPFRRTAN